jgi:predicted dehydrogenase
MGNQGTADSDLRRAAAILKHGALGPVKEVHVWSNRPVWPQGIERPTEFPGIPKHIHWYEWLGPAPDRPYHPAYHPFKWRGFWDFGTGALGDMACHTFNMPFMGLNLRDPYCISAKSSGHNGETFPKSSVIKFQFGELDGRPPCVFTWYDGGERPGPEILKDEYVSWVRTLHPDVEDIGQYIESGTLVVGTQAALFSPGDYSDDIKVFGAEEPEVEFEESPGHFTEWVLAIEEGGEAVSNFPNYAAPLTETILLGNLALWKGDTINWDAKNMKAKGRPDLDRIIKPEYREGYTLG